MHHQTIDILFGGVFSIKSVYSKYYLQEIVDMFCEFHSRDNIMQDIMEGNVYILLDDGELIGTGTKKGNHITRVYLPKFQKKGYGTFIMNQGLFVNGVLTNTVRFQLQQRISIINI